MDVSLLALAVVAVAVGSLHDAGRPAGRLVAVAVAGGRRLLDQVDGDEGGEEEEHDGGTHLVGWFGLEIGDGSNALGTELKRVVLQRTMLVWIEASCRKWSE